MTKIWSMARYRQRNPKTPRVLPKPAPAFHFAPPAGWHPCTYKNWEGFERDDKRAAVAQITHPERWNVALVWTEEQRGALHFLGKCEPEDDYIIQKDMETSRPWEAIRRADALLEKRDGTAKMCPGRCGRTLYDCIGKPGGQRGMPGPAVEPVTAPEQKAMGNLRACPSCMWEPPADMLGRAVDCGGVHGEHLSGLSSGHFVHRAAWLAKQKQDRSAPPPGYEIERDKYHHTVWWCRREGLTIGQADSRDSAIAACWAYHAKRERMEGMGTITHRDAEGTAGIHPGWTYDVRADRWQHESGAYLECLTPALAWAVNRQREAVARADGILDRVAAQLQDLCSPRSGWHWYSNYGLAHCSGAWVRKPISAVPAYAFGANNRESCPLAACKATLEEAAAAALGYRISLWTADQSVGRPGAWRWQLMCDPAPLQCGLSFDTAQDAARAALEYHGDSKNVGQAQYS